MKLSQRLGNILKEDYIRSYIDLIVGNKGSCDEVWLATEYGFPPLEKHEKIVEKLCEYAAEFRKAGIAVSLQLSNSLGHGEYMSVRDCTGLVYEGSPVGHMVGADGKEANYCFCPRSEFLKEYLIKELRLYCRIKPDTVWIDDDFRLRNHAPVDFGCFCPRCLHDFNEKYGYAFDREGLVDAFLHGDGEVRLRYIEFQREGMFALMLEMGRAVHAVSPDTALGYQYSNPGLYVGGNAFFVFDAMKEATGKAPLSRPGGGVYDDNEPSAFIGKAQFLALANSSLPDYVTEKCAEIENLPFVAFGKTPAGTAFESSLYLAFGLTDLTYSMIMEQNEPMSRHAEEFRLFAAHRGYWEMLADINRRTYAGGMRYYISTDSHKRRLSPDAAMKNFCGDAYDRARLWLRDAIPLVYDREENDVLVLHPDVARLCSDEEIKALLSKNVITDGETAAYLAERGLFSELSATRVSESDKLKVAEKLTEHAVNPKELRYWVSSFFTPGKNDVYCLTETDTAVEVLGRYAMAFEGNAPDDAFLPDGIAEAIVTTKRGGRWAILGYAPWKGVISLDKRDQILNIADYLSQNSLPARLITPLKAVLSPRRSRDGKTVCVSIANCTVGKSGELSLLIRNPESKNFFFRSQTLPPMPVSYTEREDGYLLTLPSVDAWSVGTVYCV